MKYLITSLVLFTISVWVVAISPSPVPGFCRDRGVDAGQRARIHNPQTRGRLYRGRDSGGVQRQQVILRQLER